MKTIENTFNEYLDKFCKKHNIKDQYYYTKHDYSEVSINNNEHQVLDIIYDIDHNIPKEVYWKWRADYKKWWEENRICCKSYSEYCRRVEGLIDKDIKLQKFFDIYDKYNSKAAYNDVIGIPYNETELVKQEIENSGYLDYTFEDFKNDYKMVNLKDWDIFY